MSELSQIQIARRHIIQAIVKQDSADTEAILNLAKAYRYLSGSSDLEADDSQNLTLEEFNKRHW